MLQGCIIHVDDGLTEIWEAMIKYRTIDTLNFVVILKPVRSLLDDPTRIHRKRTSAAVTAEHANARKQIFVILAF
jgi:hypothetical protein